MAPVSTAGVLTRCACSQLMFTAARGHEECSAELIRAGALLDIVQLQGLHAKVADFMVRKF